MKKTLIFSLALALCNCAPVSVSPLAVKNIQEALTDLARRAVERTLEDW
jgi:hypothetical protein